MIWLNLLTSNLRAPEFVSCGPVARATWLCVLAYCVEQENRGTISGAKDWGDRRWQQTCGVTLKEVNGSSPLLSWDNSDLLVWAYPSDKQAEVEAKREAGRVGGVRSGQARREAQLQAQLQADLERKGMEGKGREGNKPASQSADEMKLESDPKPDPTAALRLRAQKLHGKRAGTPWDKAEESAWKSARPLVEATTEDEWALIEWFYAQPQAVTFARKALAQTLNNWSGEIQRARQMKVPGVKLTPQQLRPSVC